MEAEQNKTSAVTQTLHIVVPIHHVFGFIREGTITNRARQRSAVERDSRNLFKKFKSKSMGKDQL